MKKDKNGILLAKGQVTRGVSFWYFGILVILV